MKTISNLALVALAGCALALSPLFSTPVEAGQPNVWTLNVTNASLLAGAVATVTSNGLNNTATWTGVPAQTSGSNYVDTLQSSLGTLSSTFNFTPTGLMAGDVNNTVTTYFSGSDDLSQPPVPWTNTVAFNVPGTTNQFAGYTPLSLSPFRYIIPTAIVYSVTNGSCTNVPVLTTNQFGVYSNSNLSVKFLLKGP